MAPPCMATCHVPLGRIGVAAYGAWSIGTSTPLPVRDVGGTSSFRHKTKSSPLAILTELVTVSGPQGPVPDRVKGVSTAVIVTDDPDVFRTYQRQFGRLRLTPDGFSSM